MATESDEQKREELAAIVEEIKARVRARYPEGQVQGIGVALPDLLPVLHAKDAAEAKVAAIGSVNPRPGGPVNAAIQFFKNQIARGLGWFVRDQITFNRSVIIALDAVLESLNDMNRTFVGVGGALNGVREEAVKLQAEAWELKDIRVHWLRWREDWEKKLYQNEIHFLRSVADLRASYEHRSLITEASFNDAMRHQHAEFTSAAERAIADAQNQLAAELEKVRLEYEALIHSELRVLRQKAEAGRLVGHSASAPLASSAADLHFGQGFDYTRFADRFRGSEDYVRKNQAMYPGIFSGCRKVLDIGCGRGELLGLLKESGIEAQGIDLDADSVGLCAARGLQAEVADAFAWLPEQSDGAFDGIIASQVVEHLPPERIPDLVRIAASKLSTGGVLAFETPNPECLAIFASHFYLDPTHTRPVPAQLLAFYMEEAGIGRVEVKKLSPAQDSMPSLAELPEEFRNAFFGGLDYVIYGRKLTS